METLAPVIDFYGHLIPPPTVIEELAPGLDGRGVVPTGTPGFLAKTGALKLGTAQGRDVSSWDGTVAYDPYAFVINKATEGSTFRSPGTATRQAAIRAKNKRYSAYHYAQPGNGGQQADLMLAVDGMPRAGDFPGWIDYEVDGLGVGYVNDFMTRYRSRVAVWPGLYTGLSRFQNELQSGRGWRAAGQLLWLAHYGVPAPGAPCDIWQWQGAPDLDTAYTALAAMTVGALRTPAGPVKGPIGYPFGPDPSNPYGSIGVKPAGSRAYLTRTGDTWTSILLAHFPGTVMGKVTTNPAALKRWHQDHGGNRAYVGYATFGVGAVIVLPTSSPGMLT